MPKDFPIVTKERIIMDMLQIKRNSGTSIVRITDPLKLSNWEALEQLIHHFDKRSPIRSVVSGDEYHGELAFLNTSDDSIIDSRANECYGPIERGVHFMCIEVVGECVH